MASDADTIAQLQLSLQQSEERLQEVQRKRQEEQRKRQEVEDKARGLSWLEALSPSAFTAATDCLYPVQVVHWTNFHQEHETAFTHLCNQFGQPEVAAFESNEFYKENTRIFMRQLVLKDEVDLVAYEKRTVEEMVVSAWEKKGGEIIEFKRREDHTLNDVTLRLE